MGTKKLQFLYDSKPIESYTTVRVQLFNYTDKDYTKIPIYLKIDSDPDDSLLVIESNVVGSAGLEETVKTLKSETTSINGSLKCNYFVEVVNRADSVGAYFFDGLFTILSKSQPVVTVAIEKDGLTLTEWKKEHFFKIAWWETDTATLIWILIGYGIIIFVAVKLATYTSSRRAKRWGKYLKKHLTERINVGKVTLDSESIINNWNKIDTHFDYDDSWAFTRWLKRKEPPEDDV